MTDLDAYISARNATSRTAFERAICALPNPTAIPDAWKPAPVKAMTSSRELEVGEELYAAD